MVARNSLRSGLKVETTPEKTPIKCAHATHDPNMIQIATNVSTSLWCVGVISPYPYECGGRGAAVHQCAKWVHMLRVHALKGTSFGLRLNG